MTIAEAAKKYNISAATIRYYEKIGLLPKIHRNSGGIRDFSEIDCNWINFIKCMRSAGISIDILSKYVTFFQQGDFTENERKNLLIEQRKQLAEKINDMKKALERLDFKIKGYEEKILSYEKKLLK